MVRFAESGERLRILIIKHEIERPLIPRFSRPHPQIDGDLLARIEAVTPPHVHDAYPAKP
jgi:hypothetical protein